MFEHKKEIKQLHNDIQKLIQEKDIKGIKQISFGCNWISLSTWFRDRPR